MELLKTSESSALGRFAGLVGRRVGRRRGLILLSVAVMAIAASSSWGWLVAAGIAPLLLSLAPCAPMCAIGLCMKMKKDTGGAGPEEKAVIAAPPVEPRRNPVE